MAKRTKKQTAEQTTTPPITVIEPTPAPELEPDTIARIQALFGQVHEERLGGGGNRAAQERARWHRRTARCGDAARLQGERQARGDGEGSGQAPSSEEQRLASHPRADGRARALTDKLAMGMKGSFSSTEVYEALELSTTKNSWYATIAKPYFIDTGIWRKENPKAKRGKDVRYLYNARRAKQAA